MTPDGPTAYIEATWDDYRLAYELAQTVLKASLHELSPAARDLYDQISGVEGELTRREVRELTGWSQRRVVDTLAELEGMEYVARTAGSNGMTMRYTVLPSNGPASVSSAPMKHILHPDELRKLLEARRSSRQTSNHGPFQPFQTCANRSNGLTVPIAALKASPFHLSAPEPPCARGKLAKFSRHLSKLSRPVRTGETA